MSTVISADLVKELREKTNAGVMDCKKALAESKGDLEQATKILRSKGVVKAQKKKDRVASEGMIYSYIHLGGRIGVLLEINCETDFVAKNQVFQSLAKEVAMQIAAVHPQFVKREDVPSEWIEERSQAWVQEFKNKPKEVADKILSGKLDKYYQEICLLEQPFIKDGDITIGDYINTKIAELGENIVIRRFSRFELGSEA